jgi:hypothetical protein
MKLTKRPSELYIGAPANNNGIVYSYDGIVWSQTNIEDDDITYIKNFNDEVFLAYGINTPIYYSTNGLYWQSCINTNKVTWIEFNDKIAIACVEDDYEKDSYFLKYSYNGREWLDCDVPLGHDSRLKYVQYHNGIWVMNSYSNDGLLYSENGITWHRSNITYGDIFNVYYIDNLWLATTFGANYDLFYSHDGKEWVYSTDNNLDNINFKDIYYYKKKYAGVDYTDDNTEL